MTTATARQHRTGSTSACWTMGDLHYWLLAWGRAARGRVGPMGYPSASVEHQAAFAFCGGSEDDDRPEIGRVENALTAIALIRWDGKRRLLAIKLRYLYGYRPLCVRARLLAIRKCECDAYIDQTERMVLDLLNGIGRA